MIRRGDVNIIIFKREGVEGSRKVIVIIIK